MLYPEENIENKSTMQNGQINNNNTTNDPNLDQLSSNIFIRKRYADISLCGH